MVEAVGMLFLVVFAALMCWGLNGLLGLGADFVDKKGRFLPAEERQRLERKRLERAIARAKSAKRAANEAEHQLWEAQALSLTAGKCLECGGKKHTSH